MKHKFTKGNPYRFCINDPRVTGPNNSRWNGGRFISSYGYTYIKQPEHRYASRHGYVQEHRILFEKYHNCCLLPWAHIHHINRIKTDNTIANLQGHTNPTHVSLHHQEAGGQMVRRIEPGRKCVTCGTDKTQIRYGKHPVWNKVDNGFECKNCNERRRYAISKKQKTL